jgi:hypothetical protein
VRDKARKDDNLHLIGDVALCALYQKALREIGFISIIEPEGAALRGLLRISGSIQW